MTGTWVRSVFRRIRGLVDRSRSDGQADERLLEQFVSQRDDTAFTTLLTRHGPMVMGTCLRILYDRHLAEDAFQATFLVLALNAHSIHKRGSVAGWLHGVAVRLARKLLAETCRSRQPDERQVSQTSQDAPMEASLREQRELLDEELERLPDKYRLPLLLCYFEGRTLEEAAAQLGFSAGKVKGLLDRGRERLRFRLVRRGFTLGAAGLVTLLTGTELTAAVPVRLADATVQAALNLVAGQTLIGCGVSMTVANLTKGGLTMGLKNMMVMTSLALLIGALGVGAMIWAVERGDQPQPFAPSVVQEPKVDAASSIEVPLIQHTSKPVLKDDVEFQVVSSALWPMPGPTGGTPVQFRLLVTNRGKNDVKFQPIEGKPILQSADGKELPMKMVGQNHVRRIPEPVSIEAGKTVTVNGGGQLGRYNNIHNMNWEDETGMVWSIEGVTPGKYQLSLQYKTANQVPGQLFDVRTATVSVEIVDLKESEPTVTRDFQVIALADSTWQVPAEGKRTQIGLGFRVANVQTTPYPWICPTLAKVSIKSADGKEYPSRKTTTATVAQNEPQVLVLAPKVGYTVAGPASLFHTGKALTLAWADGAGNVWHVDNLRPGRYSVQYVVRAEKASKARPVTWTGDLPTATINVEIKE